MPSAALISSTRMRMPFTVALEKLTIGPDRSCAVPMTISFADTPCCASAGVAANSASVATAIDFMAGLLPVFFVMVGLVPAMHDLSLGTILKSWMPGTRPGMTQIDGRVSHSGRFPQVHGFDQVAVLLVHQ